MNQIERESLIEHASQYVAKVTGEVEPTFYDAKLRQKMLMTLDSIDRVSVATSTPLVITGLIDGVDVLVMRNPVFAAPVEAALAFDARALIPGDELKFDLVGELLSQIIPHDAEGGLVYQSVDGTTYIAFRSPLRHAVLKSVGISTLDSAVIDIPLGTVLQ